MNPVSISKSTNVSFGGGGGGGGRVQSLKCLTCRICPSLFRGVFRRECGPVIAGADQYVKWFILSNALATREVTVKRRF